ncbi:hypothetical protein KFU94_61070 [Chloroflexi bacterium TSY]|nr:hypothetical protein [Chloroflexi bacterium TSY]
MNDVASTSLMSNRLSKETPPPAAIQAQSVQQPNGHGAQHEIVQHLVQQQLHLMVQQLATWQAHQLNHSQ